MTIEGLALASYLLALVVGQLAPACPAEGIVSSPYGPRVDPVTHVESFHGGVDIANVEGTPIRAPWAGKVVRVFRHRTSGRFVTLQTGRYRMTFMHLQRAAVKPGDWVRRGTVLGYMGSTGKATGVHLHLEARRSGHRGRIDPGMALWTCQDPLTRLPDRRRPS